mgnify:FL=1
MTFNPFSIISIVLFSDFISLPQNQHYLSMSNLRTRVAIISQIRK